MFINLAATVRVALAVIAAAALRKPVNQPSVVRALALHAVKTGENVIIKYRDRKGVVTMREVEVIGYEAQHDLIRTRCTIKKQYRMFKIAQIEEIQTAGRVTVTPVLDAVPAKRVAYDARTVEACAGVVATR